MVSLGFTGCAGSGASMVERRYQNPYHPRAWSLAVVPFRDLSGSETLDVMAVTDEFHIELQSIEGLHVMPVNRVLAAMMQLNMNKVNSPEDVTALAGILKVDAIIAGAVTRYDPYPPPQLGMIVQLYDRKDFLARGLPDYIDPGKLARMGKNFDMGTNASIKPVIMVTRIFDAAKKDVIERIKEYAQSRQNINSLLAWEKYTTSRNYLRFVSHEIIGELMAQQAKRISNSNQTEEVY